MSKAPVSPTKLTEARIVENTGLVAKIQQAAQQSSKPTSAADFIKTMRQWAPTDAADGK
jgi:hypothetical protein